VNDDEMPVEPVEMSPTRAELIARVRSRGRQIRARRRVAITGLTALVVLAIAAPAIAIGARSSSHSVPPAVVVHGTGDFRVALVEHSSSDTSKTASSCVKYYFENNCLALGRTLVTARDVRSTAVVYDKFDGWSVNVDISHSAAGRITSAANKQVAIIVGGKVVGTPFVTSALTGGVVTLSGPSVTNRGQAIALATAAAGRAPTHVDPEPDLTATIELPSTTLVSGATMPVTLVIVNHTAHTIAPSTRDGCPVQWDAELTGAGTGSTVALTERRVSTPCPTGSPLAPGTNRIHLTVTAVSFCSSATTTLPGVPTCLANGEGPPLAPGDYEVRVTANSAASPSPDPVPVRIVAAPTTPTLGH
jgi:hypothetical protein